MDAKDFMKAMLEAIAEGSDPDNEPKAPTTTRVEYDPALSREERDVQAIKTFEGWGGNFWPGIVLMFQSVQSTEDVERLLTVMENGFGFVGLGNLAMLRKYALPHLIATMGEHNAPCDAEGFPIERPAKPKQVDPDSTPRANFTVPRNKDRLN